MGGIFAGSCCLSARLRNKDDPWNAAVGGAAAGSVFGLRGESNGLTCFFALGLDVSHDSCMYQLLYMVNVQVNQTCLT